MSLGKEHPALNFDVEARQDTKEARLELRDRILEIDQLEKNIKLIHADFSPYPEFN